MKDYTLSELQKHCQEMFSEYGENACEICGQTEIGELCLGKFNGGISEIEKIDFGRRSN